MKHQAFHENYEMLLLAYAAGALDTAQNFAVSVHMALSPPARIFVKKCEAIGGALIEKECKPVAMRSDALQCVLGKLDAPQQKPEDVRYRHVKVELPPEIRIPVSLLETVSCRPCRPKWKRALIPGLNIFDLPLECQRSTVRFMKANPAAKMPHHLSSNHRHEGIEIFLVLDGTYYDDTGKYQRGDMLVADEEQIHEGRVCRDNGAVTMVVSSGGVRFSGLASLLNPFFR